VAKRQLPALRQTQISPRPILALALRALPAHKPLDLLTGSLTTLLGLKAVLAPLALQAALRLAILPLDPSLASRDHPWPPLVRDRLVRRPITRPSDRPPLWPPPVAGAVVTEFGASPLASGHRLAFGASRL
jgi:hypothetical protein